jgi:predicted nucleic-acid-binding protein
VKITVDTNVAVRAIVQDDVKQTQVAARSLKDADEIAVSLAPLSELVWVLQRIYGFSKTENVLVIRKLAGARNVSLNRSAVDLGLAVLLAGGDFADGVIAFEGQWLGGDVFVSFDKEAVAVLRNQGHTAVPL